VSALPGQGQKGGMLESILTLLVEEVRELKKSNQDLHKEVVLLREKQEQTDEKVERISQAAPGTMCSTVGCHHRLFSALMTHNVDCVCVSCRVCRVCVVCVVSRHVCRV
jgi:aspartokinase